MLGDMARNLITISADPSAVFETLSDPFAYSDWVVGTAEIVEADEAWPEPGSRFSYRAGPFPLRWNGTTQVVDAEPGRRLVLRTVLPFGSVEIDIEVHGTEAGAEVSLTEIATSSPARAALDVAFHFRNAETLARLKSLVEGGDGGIVHADAVAALGPGPHLLDADGYGDILSSSDRCYLTVGTKSGPHVTPTAFTYSSGRLWILTQRGSLKERRIERHGQASVLFRDGDRSIVVAGSAAVLDPGRLWLPQDLRDRALAVPALGRYLVDQRAMLGGFLSGSLSSLADLNPIQRVLICVAPEGVVLVDHDEVVSRRGRALLPARTTPAPGDTSSHAGEPLDLDEVPDSVASLAEESRTEAVLGIDTPWGPVALPARWHPERSLVSVATAVLGSFTSGPVGLCLDSDEGEELEDKEGMLVRGRGRVLGSQKGFAAIAIDQDKTTVWQGADATTVQN